MANEEHLKIIKQGVETQAFYRKWKLHEVGEQGFQLGDLRASYYNPC